MKVCYVHHCGNVSGALISLIELVRELKIRGVSELILCPPGLSLDRIKYEGFNFKEISEPFLFASGAGNALRGRELLRLLYRWLKPFDNVQFAKILKEFKPDIVHLNERGLFQAAKVAKKQGLTTVFHARNVADRSVRWAHDLSISLLKKYADAVIAIDGSVANSLREYERLSVVYNSVSSEWLDNEPIRKGVSEGVRVLLLCNLTPQKGVWEFLQAAKMLRSLKNVQFWIAGDNPRPDRFYRTWYGRIAGGVGLTPDMRKRIESFVRCEELSNVKVLGRIQDVKNLLLQIDINVFPSRLNGPARSVFEAGILGIPSILALKDRVEDIVQDGVNGIIIPEGDVKCLADAVRILSSDHAYRDRLGASAARDFRIKFNAGRNADEVMKVYRKLLRDVSGVGHESLLE
jgi:glycosyltransferase involved in cell wall biosynthesis